jgi:Nitroreductase family
MLKPQIEENGVVSMQARRPWEVAKRSFPSDGSGADKLRAAVDYAVLAPSGHNTQPWRFKVVAEALELWADRTRALAVVDPHDRELTRGG